MELNEEKLSQAIIDGITASMIPIIKETVILWLEADKVKTAELEKAAADKLLSNREHIAAAFRNAMI